MATVVLSANASREQQHTLLSTDFLKNHTFRFLDPARTDSSQSDLRHPWSIARFDTSLLPARTDSSLLPVLLPYLSFGIHRPAERPRAPRWPIVKRWILERTQQASPEQVPQERRLFRLPSAHDPVNGNDYALLRPLALRAHFHACTCIDLRTCTFRCFSTPNTHPFLFPFPFGPGDRDCDLMRTCRSR